MGAVMKELGETKRISLKEVFDNEATEFTPWLSSNLDRLATELGFELEHDDTEVKDGELRSEPRRLESSKRGIQAIYQGPDLRVYKVSLLSQPGQQCLRTCRGRCEKVDHPHTRSDTAVLQEIGTGDKPAHAVAHKCQLLVVWNAEAVEVEAQSIRKLIERC